jgi:hypothetical protein
MSGFWSVAGLMVCATLVAVVAIRQGHTDLLVASLIALVGSVLYVVYRARFAKPPR